MAAIPSYRAEMVGLSEHDRTLLRSFLAASQARTGVRWDGGANHPAVYFIDLDSQPGADFWHSLPENERRDAAIVISSTLRSEVRWLAKPLRSATLLMVLEQMALASRAPTPAPQAPAAAPRPQARIPQPGEPLGLLDVLDGAAGTTARTVQSAHWPDLVLGNNNTHAMRTAPLEEYADGFVASLEVTRVVKYTGGPMDDELRVELDTLRWLALLYAPIGEIAGRLPYPKRVRLRRPPAFGHLPHKLHHVRMAATLAQHPATPPELAEIAGADEETVQRFLGACAAVGLLEDVAEPVPVRAPAPQPVIAAPAPQPVAAAAAPRPAAPSVATIPAPQSTSQPVVAPAAAAQSAIALSPSSPARAAPAAAAAPAEPAAAEPTAEPAPAAEATNKASEPPPSAGSVSVLERLRESREQNRARVAAAIRSISQN